MASLAGRYSCRVRRLRNRKGPEYGPPLHGSRALNRYSDLIPSMKC